MKTYLPLVLSFYCAMGAATGNAAPYCSQHKPNKELIIAYLGADSSWKLKDTDQSKLAEQLSQVSLVNYSFIRLSKDAQGNTILKLAPQDIENIQTIRQLKPDLPIMIAVGGWGERDGFTSFLENDDQMTVFINSVQEELSHYHLDGIDVDWENELLASRQESKGLATLLQRLHDSIEADGYCLSNAVPGTSAYWKRYPNAKLWQSAVNWTTVMSYDHYGTFGPRTEYGAALYENNRPKDTSYPYPTTSGDKAVRHYHQQSLPAQKIILGMPFYCHSYYIKNNVLDQGSATPGLHAAVLDPNISSQVSYNDAYNLYGDKLFMHQTSYGNQEHRADSFYGVIPQANTNVSRFMSCDAPQAVLDKIAYVEGANSMTENGQKMVKLGGVSFWSLQQDLAFTNPNSLLRAIHDGFAAGR